MSASHENYRIFAIKFAHHHRLTRDNFLGGDPHDGPIPIDYFVWAIVGTTRTIMVDPGFDAAMARQRGRTITHCIEDGLSQLGIDAGKIEDVIISHMHYDHAGNHGLFPNARFHLQDREMAFCTGRCMGHHGLSQAFDVEDVKAMVGRLFAGRLQFHHGDAEIAPGISVHRVGGHTDGLQIIRVHTARGWVVLASDATHFYANIQQRRPYPILYNVGDVLEGYNTLYRWADSFDHIIPGHDPMVLQRYPAGTPETAAWIAQVDVAPLTQWT